MPFEHDDPRLTAYALGELDADQRPAVEALLSENAEAQRIVEEIRSLANLLTDQLRAETAQGLRPDQRLAIEQRAQAQSQNAVIAKIPAWARALRYGVAASALTLVAGVSYIAWKSDQAKRDAAVFADRAAPAVEAPQPMGRRAGALASAVAEGFDEAAPPAPAGAAPRFAEPTDRLDEHTESQSRGAMVAPTPTTGTGLGGRRSSVGRELEARRDASDGSFAGLQVDHKAGAPAPGGAPRAPAGPQEKEGLLGLKQRQPADFDAQKTESFHESRGESLGANAPATQPTEFGIELDKGRLARGQLNTDLALGDTPGRMLDTEAKVADPSNIPAPPASVAPPAEPAQGKDLFFAPQEQEQVANPVGRYRKKLAEQLGRANTEQYAPINENEPTPVTPESTLSTFAVDVDTAAYANVRRFVAQQNTLPPPDAVRVEELLNYFAYDYPEPSGDAPFSVDTEVTRCPWNSEHLLLRIGLKGKSVAFENRKPANIVFLVDASGSMDEPAKMPLLKAGLRMLVEQLGENDKISIVTYANGSGVALPPTVGHHKPEILSAIDQIQPGGSTNGAAGINTAYELATQNFVPGGINRVILATDGDFNVGTTDVGSLTRMAEEKAKTTGVFLNVLGFGAGNLKDETMEQIADKGNGQYGYIDSLLEARKTFVEQVGGTLVTIAKDVKIQVDFNPAKVGAYRQIGYENRAMAARDFRNDAKDAGEIGSGHTVTALYEIIPPSEETAKLAAKYTKSDFVKPAEVADSAKQSDKLAVVRLRYKQPDGDTATEFDHPVKDEIKDFGAASSDTRFAASVALFGMLLRESKFAGSATLDAVLELAQSNMGRDPGGYRAEFVELVKQARSIVAQP